MVPARNPQVRGCYPKALAMPSENYGELVLLASRCLQALESQNDVLHQIANSLMKPKRSGGKKSEQIDQRIAMMMAWIGHTNETSQVRLADHFGVAPSSIRGKKYEPVRLAIAMNKAASRAAKQQPKPKRPKDEDSDDW